MVTLCLNKRDDGFDVGEGSGGENEERGRVSSDGGSDVFADAFGAYADEKN